MFHMQCIRRLYLITHLPTSTMSTTLRDLLENIEDTESITVTITEKIPIFRITPEATIKMPKRVMGNTEHISKLLVDVFNGHMSKIDANAKRSADQLPFLHSKDGYLKACTKFKTPPYEIDDIKTFASEAHDVIDELCALADEHYTNAPTPYCTLFMFDSNYNKVNEAYKTKADKTSNTSQSPKTRKGKAKAIPHTSPMTNGKGKGKRQAEDEDEGEDSEAVTKRRRVSKDDVEPATESQPELRPFSVRRDQPLTPAFDPSL